MAQLKIGKFIAEMRKEQSYTQRQLADILGISDKTISKWETGHNMPDLDILIEISDYYEVDLREILNGERKSENMDFVLLARLSPDGIGGRYGLVY